MCTDKKDRSAKLRELAIRIRNNLPNTGLVAEGFELIADAMEPCYDCGQQDHDPENDPANVVQHGVMEIHTSAAGLDDMDRGAF